MPKFNGTPEIKIHVKFSGYIPIDRCMLWSHKSELIGQILKCRAVRTITKISKRMESNKVEA